jgi:hypothetical protein
MHGSHIVSRGNAAIATASVAQNAAVPRTRQSRGNARQRREAESNRPIPQLDAQPAKVYKAGKKEAKPDRDNSMM